MSQYYDAFISYGRADSKALAVKLYQDLTEAGFKIWFDQNDIPLAVDFQNQIDDGIEKSRNFLFIIAPHSVNSPYCVKEIELAVKYKKRIIPLLHVEQITKEIWQERNPGKTEADWGGYQEKGHHSCFPNMHPEISRINWVYFRENVDNYQQSLTDLIELFNCQQDYVTKHAQILVKALEWERNKKLTRYLLVGKERQEAEQWLKIEFKNEQPPCLPTDLHCEFICESIKNANNLMTQVFLSYSEKNRFAMEMVRKYLLRHGITVWTNQTDIKTGTEFQQAINRGIEAADNFVFLLSPESLESEYCRQELTLSLSLNKRIFSLLIELTDLKTIPPELQQLQFINLVEAEDQKGLDNLIKELAENAVYYQQHKVLLVKASKWREQNRNPSLLLRGYNLEHYQSWLETAGKKELHPPTDLQREFLAESAKQPPDLALDVFVSYSRADSDFARKLNEALQTQGKTTWFDQESIATGTDFQTEIYRGIEHSDNFLFVISPDSVRSPYCANEVEYARKLNKRFVTVLHRQVNCEELHPELAKVQWLDFNRHNGDFYANFSELVRTLDTDREYVREHTKKSQAALEWKQADKSVDLLLRGNECNRAYEWLQEVEQNNKKPGLTEWLREYIVVSKEELERLQKIEMERQQRELRKQRRDKLILSGFLALMTGLSIFSWWQTVKAQRQSEIALARQLAAESESMRLQHRALHHGSGLLATESMKKFQELNLPLIAADRALRGELALLPDFLWGINHNEPVNTVAFSSDGKYVASASYDATAEIWEVVTGKRAATLKHDDGVTALAFSADSKYVVTASSDSTAAFWEVATGKQIAKLNHDGPVELVALSPDGQYVATGSYNGIVKVWSSATGGEVFRLDRAYLQAFTFSPDSKYLAIGSADNAARVWEAATGKQILRVNHDNWVNAVAFSPDGNYLATASTDGIAKVWNAASGKEVSTFKHRSTLVKAVAFSPDGQYLATASKDAQLWEVTTGKEVATFKHDSIVNAVQFSPDGKHLATASWDKTAGVWDIATGKEIARINHDRRLADVAFSPDGKHLATASWDNTAGVWNITAGAEVARLNHDEVVWTADFTPDGKYVATASSDKTARLWDAVTGKEVLRLNHEESVRSVIVSDDGKYVATAGYDNAARVWDIATGKAVAKINRDDDIQSLTFSPDARYLATASDDSTARVWDALTGDEIARFDHDEWVEAVAFSPDGKYVASASRDKTARVWEIATGKEVARFNHNDWVWVVAFSPNGKYVVSGDEDNTAWVWNAATGKEVARLNHNEKGSIKVVAFSPDGRYVATASSDTTARLWDAASGTEIARLNHNETVNAVAFSADGKYIASASFDNTARMLDVATGEEVSQFQHDDSVWSVAFSADGKYLATASSDNTARVHLLKPEDLINEACRRFRRNLTADEWQNYFNKDLQQYQKTCEALPVDRSLVAEVRKLAERDKLKEAEELLGALVKLDDKIDFLPQTEALEQNPSTVVRQFQAEGKVREGVQLAEQEKVPQAIALFQQAQKLLPGIDLNPYTEDMEKEGETVARELAARNLVERGVSQIDGEEVEEAIALFQKAQSFLPELEINPDTIELSLRDYMAFWSQGSKSNLWKKFIENDPAALARHLAALSSISNGLYYARIGEVEEAIALFQQAQKFQPDIDLNPYTPEIDNDPEALARELTEE